ncbi:ATP-binding protein, partial [Pseudomonas viridiflava]|uniref:ATP-binding protein n=1 Tax=Pseudomonas viridiflava TaxID=33069 RepID=UPI001F14E7A7
PGLFSTLGMIHGAHLQLINDVEPGMYLPWDREDILGLLGNLLDNACKWADSGVRLNILRQEQGFCLLIDDDGPGIPESQRAEVFSRGARLDEQITGHGLGLGIERDIVE